MTSPHNSQAGSASEALSDLADRCEKATGPDAAINGDIWKHLNPNTVKGWHAPNGVSIDGYARHVAPQFTGSIDAAERLMPDNTEVIQYWILGKKPSVSVRHAEWDGHTNANTKPLALCAAALRARSATS